MRVALKMKLLVTGGVSFASHHTHSKRKKTSLPEEKGVL